MAKFIKKPVVIEAHNISDSDWPDWLIEARPIVTITGDGTELDIVTLEGVMHANAGDWIIRGIKGELYPCKPDIFAATYAPATDTASDMGNVNDGYHTFNELYEHRHALFLIVMGYAFLSGNKTWVEYDSETDGWFLAGIDTLHGQISYHLPMRLLPIAKRQVSEGYQRIAYDGYTSADVLRRLQAIVGYKEA